MKYILLCLLFMLGSLSGSTQSFHPGFEGKEYHDLLLFSFRGFSESHFDSISKGHLYYQYRSLFISPEVGLKNRCEMYLRNDAVAIINLRGTVPEPVSWLANFYSGMIPAEGTLQLNDSTRFSYQVAGSKTAYVHAGWMLGLAHLSPYLIRCIDSLRTTGVTQFIVSGHSQGGALALLTTSWLYYRYQGNNLQFKTYASAAPKPGNLFYAYDFESITRGGMGFRVVNTADWVPETPLTVQTINDFNPVNPITDARKILKKQQLLTRLFLLSKYNTMVRRSSKTMHTYRKNLGRLLGKAVQKPLPGYQPSTLVYSSNYFTAGTPVILTADTNYHSKFVFDGSNYFIHHMLEPYRYLLQQHYHVKSK